MGLLDRIEPNQTSRVIEFGCGTGPLLERIEGQYEKVLGVDNNEAMLNVARQRVASAEVLEADFREWSASEAGGAFDAAVLMGGLLHLTHDSDVEAFAATVYDSLREGGRFGTFFQPLSDDLDNGSRERQTVESERFVVDRHSVSAVTSPEGQYTTTYLFHIRDKIEDTEAKMGTVFHGRFHDPDTLEKIFLDVGFDDVKVSDGNGSTVLRAVK
ncbi:class I SAM-dependent methyltransferase [Halomicroarcula sp. F13]|uniref:Class I SAM-dependent methyltransferase n=1 Tax=Haloarcula rubra TaxID=2487747 RepID=A0AAW4PVK1_9EURY|nr:class I SAM-dependent methyltransferase [Halomicroarcula rubra]MBX0324388.1 class I SAM-dependent methyltransferase [Halomicroarcula rubra]